LKCSRPSPGSLLRTGLMPIVGIARNQLVDSHLGLMLAKLNFNFNTCQCKPSLSRHIASHLVNSLSDIKLGISNCQTYSTCSIVCWYSWRRSFRTSCIRSQSRPCFISVVTFVDMVAARSRKILAKNHSLVFQNGRGMELLANFS
jgi:hypothetical protein